MRHRSTSVRMVAASALLLIAVAVTSCQDLPADPAATTPGSGAGLVPGTTVVTGGGQAPAATIPTAPAAAATTPTAGAAGVGDPYFPTAGNGGYDVERYEIVLDFDPATGVLSATTTVTARAVVSLSSFNLDLSGLDVSGVELDGIPAAFARDGAELIVECPAPLRAGDTFSTTIDYSGIPEPILDPGHLTTGWQQKGDVVYTMDEPLGSAVWFPVNDHPRDKALYDFTITVPKPYTAVATGVLEAVEDGGDSRTFVWRMRQPCASYLAAIAIDDFVLQESTAPNGVRIRNYFASGLAEDAEVLFADTGEMLAFYADLFGPYPFDEYGVVVPSVETGTAMEHQTMSLFGRDLFERGLAEPTFADSYIPHELAHQWFGDSVTPLSWQDIWLNEGFATYASWLWVEHDQGPAEMEGWVRWAAARVRDKEQSAGREPPPGDPGTEDLFGTNVYQRGALTLHVLRLTVGDEVFFGILREWVSRYEYANAGTADFIALVEERAGAQSGFDVGDFFDEWLYDEEMPDLP